ncbi:hypothetical protein BGX28_005868 [Mortierella sp. GBA30]|nr:hypothetical protein BGX28_005868 [Mortierella sp. GBA30]
MCPNSRFTVNNELDTQVISVQDLLKGVVDLADCSHKVILVVDEPETQIQSAGSSLQIPFVNGAVDLENLAERLSQQCHTPLVNDKEDNADNTQDSFVMYKRLTSASAKENEIRSKSHDNFLVLYSSSQTKNFPSKQHLHARAPNEPTPTKQAGLFHQYTFFSQGIFMGLLIAVIVVPIAVMGVFWNLSVQQPQRFEKKQN